MAKFGFLSVLEEELDKHLDYDFAMDWDKKNHACGKCAGCAHGTPLHT